MSPERLVVQMQNLLFFHSILGFVGLRNNRGLRKYWSRRAETVLKDRGGDNILDEPS